MIRVVDRFDIVPVGFEKHQQGRQQFLPAMPETVFEPDDAIFVICPQEHAQEFIASNELVVLPRLSERQRHEALQELGVAEIMLSPASQLIGQTLRQLEFSSRFDLNVLAIRHRGEQLTTNLNDQPIGLWRYAAGRRRLDPDPTPTR